MTETPEETTRPVAHRLHIDGDGKIQGKAWIDHNTGHPWPCVNSGPALTPPMNGAVLHTNVGSLPGTVAVFNQAGFNASAHVEIGGHWSGNEKNGQARIWQFCSVHREAWHAMAGNSMWWGIETEDGGDPAHPLSDAQLTAVAQVVEALSAQGGGWDFPLQVTDKTGGKGLGAHFMGHAAWGGHTCPDNPPGGQGPRSHQRGEIIRRAKILRETGQFPAPAGAVNPVAALKATARFTQVDVSWVPAKNAAQYVVKAWIGDTREVASTETVTASKVTLHDLKKGTAYRISVWAEPGSGETASTDVTTKG